MPKRILTFAFAAIAVGLAACSSNGNISNLYGTPAPTSTASATPNPAATAATVNVTVSGSPLPNQPVTLSNDVNGVAGSTIATQNTNSSGATTFTGLTGAQAYCFATTYQPPAPAVAQTKSYCGVWWQSAVNFNF